MKLSSVAISALSVMGGFTLVPHVAGQVVIQRSSEVQESITPADGATQGSAIVMSASSSDGGPPVIQSMTFSGDGGTFEMAMPAFAPMVDTQNLSSLLSLPDVREELEMVDDQFKELQEAQKQLQSELQREIEKMTSGGFDPSRASGLKDLIEEQRKLVESRVQEMLAPQQLERLRQIALRVRMKQSGAIGMLGSKEVQEALEMDDEQLASLKDKAKELKEAMDKKIEELKKEAQEELLDELSSKQRKKLEELLGNEFDYKPMTFQDRFKGLPRSGKPMRIEQKSSK